MSFFVRLWKTVRDNYDLRVAKEARSLLEQWNNITNLRQIYLSVALVTYLVFESLGEFSVTNCIIAYAVQ